MSGSLWRGILFPVFVLLITAYLSRRMLRRALVAFSNRVERPDPGARPVSRARRLVGEVSRAVGGLSRLRFRACGVLDRLRGRRCRRVSYLAGRGQAASAIARRARMAQDAVRTLGRPEMVALHRGPARGIFFRQEGSAMAGAARSGPRPEVGSPTAGGAWTA